MSKPRLLDLFCKAGGATRGYQEAGFYVVGVDIAPQPNYIGDEFILADALEVPLDGYDAIHASPPCQLYSLMSNCRPGLAEQYPDLIGPIRSQLQPTGVPWVIENVPGAPLRPDLVLCGCQFGLREPNGAGQVTRERWFEFNEPQFSLAAPCYHPEPALPLAGQNPGGWYYERYGRGVSVAEKRSAMRIDWMTREELAEAIPPAYTRFIGEQLLEHIGEVATVGGNGDGGW